MKSYTGPVVVVSGAGSGMGREYAIEAARRGAAVAINDISAEGLEATTARLPTGTRVIAETLDVADRDAVYAFADRVRAELGPATVVINNAGIEGFAQPFWAITDAEIEHVMAVNFWGVIHGTRAFLPQLLEAERGAIVNVSSLFGLIGAPHSSDYCASKFAVRGFSEALAGELLHSRVGVYLVHPGGVNTNISRISDGQGFAEKYLRTPPSEVATEVLDAIGTHRHRIVVGHRAGLTALAARLLPLELMTRLIWRDLVPILKRENYPAADHAVAPVTATTRGDR